MDTYNLDCAVQVERNGWEPLFFVAESKSSLFIDDLRDRESGKIKCGEAHLGALMDEGENPARFIKASNLVDVVLSGK